ncbi:MAG: ATP-binding protein [Saprospiraceae bacterium]|nr:ATP-binding protein [Lewinella sp.]
MDTHSINTDLPGIADREEVVTPLRKNSTSVLDLIVRRIRLRSIRRIAWLRKLWRENGRPEEQAMNPHQAIDLILAGNDDRPAEIAWRQQEPDLAEINREIESIEDLLGKDQQSYFAHICRQLGLNSREADMLQATLAIAAEPELSRVFAYLQDHSGRGYVTDALINGLFESESREIMSAAAPLRIWDAVRKKEFDNGEPAMYSCDPHLLHRLQGKNNMDKALLGIAHIQSPQAALPGWPVQEVLDVISRIVKDNAWQPLRLVVSGFAGSGRKSFAATICEQLNLPLLIIDLDRVSPDHWPEVFIHAQRHAFLEISALAWVGAADWKQWKWPKIISPFQLQFIICEPGIHVPVQEGIVDHQVEMPGFTIEERRQIWDRFLPQSEDWPPEEREDLIRRFQVTIGQMSALARRSVCRPEEVTAYLGGASRHRLGELAEHLACPFHWEDLILNDWLKSYLSDFIFEAREREMIWEDQQVSRLFPRGKGLIALFSGPPGTGKTMAAQVVASCLRLELYRIDLSGVVSKYVGETSKNLERILSRARHINAVLLFDEADALFGKRTEIKDAHDRYANTDTNYLLQAIENYSGIAILATNKKSNIDSGFIRRLRFVLEFPKPDKAQRLQLWRHLVGALAGEQRLLALQPHLEKVAEWVDLNGAQIKFALLSALFLSRREGVDLNMHHLVGGLERELVKEGRGLKPELKRKFDTSLSE